MGSVEGMTEGLHSGKGTYEGIVPLGEPVRAEGEQHLVVRLVGGTYARWSGAATLPKVGERVRVFMNGIGPGVVEGYFVEYGFLGVVVGSLEAPPAWLVRQHEEKKRERGEYKWHMKALVFGCDLLDRAAWEAQRDALDAKEV